MTSIAFILGVTPLVILRRWRPEPPRDGTGVICIDRHGAAVFPIPVFFVVVRRIFPAIRATAKTRVPGGDRRIKGISEQVRSREPFDFAQDRFVEAHPASARGASSWFQDRLRQAQPEPGGVLFSKSVLFPVLLALGACSLALSTRSPAIAGGSPMACVAGWQPRRWQLRYLRRVRRGIGKPSS